MFKNARRYVFAAMTIVSFAACVSEDDAKDAAAGGEICSPNDPGGESCSDDEPCIVSCDCGDVAYEGGLCDGGSCMGATAMCTRLCADSWTGDFCAAPQPPTGETGSGGNTSSSSSSNTTNTTSTLSGPGPSGGGGAPCPDGLYRCGGVCIDLATDNDHCGQCDWDCEVGVYTCQGGECLP